MLSTLTCSQAWTYVHFRESCLVELLHQPPRMKPESMGKKRLVGRARILSRSELFVPTATGTRSRHEGEELAVNVERKPAKRIEHNEHRSENTSSFRADVPQKRSLWCISLSTKTSTTRATENISRFFMDITTDVWSSAVTVPRNRLCAHLHSTTLERMTESTSGSEFTVEPQSS